MDVSSTCCWRCTFFAVRGRTCGALLGTCLEYCWALCERMKITSKLWDDYNASIELDVETAVLFIMSDTASLLS